MAVLQCDGDHVCVTRRRTSGTMWQTRWRVYLSCSQFCFLAWSWSTKQKLTGCSDGGCGRPRWMLRLWAPRCVSVMNTDPLPESMCRGAAETSAQLNFIIIHISVSQWLFWIKSLPTRPAQLHPSCAHLHVCIIPLHASVFMFKLFHCKSISWIFVYVHNFKHKNSTFT